MSYHVEWCEMAFNTNQMVCCYGANISTLPLDNKVGRRWTNPIRLNTFQLARVKSYNYTSDVDRLLSASIFNPLCAH